MIGLVSASGIILNRTFLQTASIHGIMSSAVWSVIVSGSLLSLRGLSQTHLTFLDIPEPTQGFLKSRIEHDRGSTKKKMERRALIAEKGKYGFVIPALPAGLSPQLISRYKNTFIHAACSGQQTPRQSIWSRSLASRPGMSGFR